MTAINQKKHPVDRAEVAAEISAHDRAVSAAGVDIWLGSEPTFTQRRSEAPEWLYEALGGKKFEVAQRMLHGLRLRHPGGVVMRTLGRQYGGEPGPRWSIGYFHRRDGMALWDGPQDPLYETTAPDRVDLYQLREGLAAQMHAIGWTCVSIDTESEPRLRLLCRADGAGITSTSARDPQTRRPSVHVGAIPPSGLVDRLSARGDFLLCLYADDRDTTTIELPSFGDCDQLLQCLSAIQAAALAIGTKDLVLCGYPPPTAPAFAWTTFTPDPAVIEINAAPAPDAKEFLGYTHEVYELAAECGLSPFRLHYNGTVTESGGGGQLTLGGPTPASSPFFRRPHLLARLVRYFNNHPSLSYWFGPDYLGGASQSPRADEGTRDRLLELAVAMEQFEGADAPDPEFIWRSFYPFLTDASGNPHRSELNIEKLGNPHLKDRGCLGLVEFRALRMMPDADSAAAVAVLLRAITAMLCAEDVAPTLRDWGDQLHDRFALPFYLLDDLESVFGDLSAAGFGLGPSLRRLLTEQPLQSSWRIEHGDCEVQIDKAIEFWPLVGDVASQERSGSRTVDSSNTRLQIVLRPVAGSDENAAMHWHLSIDGHRLPLREESDADGALRIMGVRFRDFIPWAGLHPGIPAHGPLQLMLSRAGQPSLRVELHAWQPDNLAYPGLPQDTTEAADRRADRLRSQSLPPHALDLREPPAAALSDYCLDLRRLQSKRSFKLA